MARQTRVIVPGVPMHVIQRGNNKARCFESAEDFQRYRELLRDAGDRTGCALHAYVLMTNHVHLLVTPRSDHAVAKLMQCLGRRYVRYFNMRHGRTGTLWEGRYRASMIDSDRYFLACSRYIDLNPVRASIVADPADYPWSSYRSNAGVCPDPLLTRHPLVEGLGRDDAARGAAYRALAFEGIPDETLSTIRRAVQRGTILGSESGL